MLSINHYSHVPFLTQELRRLIPDGSLASRTWRAMGSELHYRLVDSPAWNEIEYSRDYPVDALFFWATKDGGLDPLWLTDEDGRFFDDNGEVIPADIAPTYSVVEQLAAYGLWVLNVLIDRAGPVPADGFGDCGWSRDEVIEHRAACLLFAYQALSYSQRILRGIELTTAERTRVDTLDFAELGRNGAKKRHAPMSELRKLAVARYKAGQWKSANQAAFQLKDEIIKHGRTIGAILSESNAQRTIAEWFRNSS